MREIKFRGKSKLVIEELEELYVEHSNGWVYGNLVMYGKTPYIVGDFIEVDLEYTINEFWIPVIHESVGQYTGLIDRNGREFFEGDIITWQDKPIFSDSEKSEKLKDIIVFEDGCFKTKTYNELLSNLARIEKTGFKFNYLTHHQTEIIGNIYENPELLGG